MFNEIAEKLISLGFKIVEQNQEILLANGPKFRIRILGGADKFQVGFESTFDRWANSVDFETKIPKPQNLDAILAEIASIEKCHFCTSWRTPHRLANRPCCDSCFQEKNKKKDKTGKRHQ